MSNQAGHKCGIRRCSVRILAGTLGFLRFYGFPQFFNTNGGIVPRLSHDHLLPGVGIATACRLDGRGKIFLLSTVSRPALGPTQPPIQSVPGALSLRVKRPRREADHCPSSTEVKNGGSIPPLPHLSSWLGA
jgi:hypothetical protein